MDSKRILKACKPHFTVRCCENRPWSRRSLGRGDMDWWMDRRSPRSLRVLLQSVLMHLAIFLLLTLETMRFEKFQRTESFPQLRRRSRRRLILRWMAPEICTSVRCPKLGDATSYIASAPRERPTRWEAV